MDSVTKERIARAAQNVSKKAMQQLRILAIFTYSYVIYAMWLIKFKLIGPPDRQWNITSMFLIREPPAPEGEPYDDDFITLDYSTIQLDGDWKRDVLRHVPNHWDEWKVEIRAIKGHKKRRIVVRHDEDMDFYKDIEKNDTMILSAYLNTPQGSINITDKARKYVTHPSRRVKAHDYFIFDDYDTLRGCDVQIRTIDRMGHGAVNTYIFE
jgi:hypothetical protein